MEQSWGKKRVQSWDNDEGRNEEKVGLLKKKRDQSWDKVEQKIREKFGQSWGGNWDKVEGKS